MRNAVVCLLALLAVPAVLCETWIGSTFVAQFKMSITRACHTPDAKLLATCDDGIIEILAVSHPSIQCRSGRTRSEVECSVACQGKECEEVFINDTTGSVTFNCAFSTENHPRASIIFDDERRGSCDRNLFYDSKAEKIARLGLICPSDEGGEAENFGHELFECGQEHDTIYLSNGEYGCKEEQYCSGSALCDLSFPPVTVVSTLGGKELNQDCFKATNVLLDDDSEQTGLESDDVDTMVGWYTAQYQASWTLYEQSSTTRCENLDPSSVEISCRSGGLMTAIEIGASIDCTTLGLDALICSGQGILGVPTVTFTCEGDSSEKAQTTLLYDEAHLECNDAAYHLIQMGALCNGLYSYEDFYWECPDGQVTVDQHKRLTCYETIPCKGETDCNGTVPFVTMDSSSNVQSCMSVTPLSDLPSSVPSMRPSNTPIMAPSTEPTTFPTSSPSGMPSDFPSMVPSSKPSVLPTRRPSVTPSVTPTIIPTVVPSGFSSLGPTSYPSYVPKSIPSSSSSDFPSSVPSNIPSITPSLFPTAAHQDTDYPSVNPPLWVDSITNLPTGHALDDDYISPTVEPAPSGGPTKISNVRGIQPSSARTPQSSSGNETIVEKGVSAGISGDDGINWKRAFTFGLLLAAGIAIGLPAFGSCSRPSM